MACRRCDESVPPTVKEWIGGNEKPAAALLDERGESRFEVALAAGIEDEERKRKRARRLFCVTQLEFGA